jgi:hypothetical protein
MVGKRGFSTWPFHAHFIPSYKTTQYTAETSNLTPISVSLNQTDSELKYHSRYLSYLSQFVNKPQSTFQHTENKF